MIGKSRKYCAPRSVAYPLQLLDVFVDLYATGSYARRQYDAPDPDRPSILLMTSGHLGDALILSYTFPLIRQQYPNARIDVVAGSWCDPIWKDNPYIRRVVHLDHVNTNRRPLSRLEKWKEFYKTTRSAIKTLKDTVYDYSVDIRFSDSPMHFLLPFLRINRKIGFGSRGLGGLLDNEFFLPDAEVHTFDLIGMLFKPMGIDANVRTVRPYFAHPTESAEQLWAKLKQPVPVGKTILICPESGSAVRMLPADFWCQLATRLLETTSCSLVFSGQTDFTTRLYERVQATNSTAHKRLFPVVGLLTLQDMMTMSQQAYMAFTLDSLPMHLCCLGCPTVSFQKNGMGLQFFPIANKPTLVFHNHAPSRFLTLDRPGAASEYVTEFNEAVLDKALQWASNFEKVS